MTPFTIEEYIQGNTTAIYQNGEYPLSITLLSGLIVTEQTLYSVVVHNLKDGRATNRMYDMNGYDLVLIPKERYIGFNNISDIERNSFAVSSDIRQLETIYSRSQIYKLIPID